MYHLSLEWALKAVTNKIRRSQLKAACEDVVLSGKDPHYDAVNLMVAQVLGHPKQRAKTYEELKRRMDTQPDVIIQLAVNTLRAKNLQQSADALKEFHEPMERDLVHAAVPMADAHAAWVANVRAQEQEETEREAPPPAKTYDRCVFEEAAKKGGAAVPYMNVVALASLIRRGEKTKSDTRNVTFYSSLQL